MTTTVPPLPDISGTPTPTEIAEFLRLVKIILEVREGVRAANTRSRFTTIQDLVDAGVIVTGDIV